MQVSFVNLYQFIGYVRKNMLMLTTKTVSPITLVMFKQIQQGQGLFEAAVAATFGIGKIFLELGVRYLCNVYIMSGRIFY